MLLLHILLLNSIHPILRHVELLRLWNLWSSTIRLLLGIREGLCPWVWLSAHRGGSLPICTIPCLLPRIAQNPGCWIPRLGPRHLHGLHHLHWLHLLLHLHLLLLLLHLLLLHLLRLRIWEHTRSRSSCICLAGHTASRARRGHSATLWWAASLGGESKRTWILLILHVTSLDLHLQAVITHLIPIQCLN